MDAGKARRARTVAALLNGTAVRPDFEAEALASEARAAARIAWSRRAIEAYRIAAEACDAAWMKLVESHPDDEPLPDIAPPPEQDEADRLHAPLAAVRDKGQWPRHLHWSL